MNETIPDPDQTDEEIVAYEVSDEALEVIGSNKSHPLDTLTEPVWTRVPCGPGAPTCPNPT